MISGNPEYVRDLMKQLSAQGLVYYDPYKADSPVARLPPLKESCLTAWDSWFLILMKSGTQVLTDYSEDFRH